MVLAQDICLLAPRLFQQVLLDMMANISEKGLVQSQERLK
jgi:hypothetical protein